MDRVEIGALPKRLLSQTFGRRHPRRFPTNDASDVEQVDDHCARVLSKQRTSQSAYQWDVLISCSRMWRMGRVRQKRRMKNLRVTASYVLPSWVSAAPSLAWWSVNSLPDRPHWSGNHSIWIYCDMASCAADTSRWMIDVTAELSMLTAWTSYLQAHMTTDEANDEMQHSHWMALLRAAITVWKEVLRVTVLKCHSWTRSSWMRTTKPAPPSSISTRTELAVKHFKSAGGMELLVCG